MVSVAAGRHYSLFLRVYTGRCVKFVHDQSNHCELLKYLCKYLQCIVIGPVCLWVCVCVGGSVTTILEIACIDPRQTGFV